MRNSSLVEWWGAENNRASSMVPKLWARKGGRGAFLLRRRCAMRHAGAARKADVGISNDKTSEKLVRRKSKVS